MNKILILADDLTGANDTGAAISGFGWNTMSVVDADTVPGDLEDYSCISVNLDSRGLKPQKAYEMTARAARTFGGPHIGLYSKRIDSTLRGNLGAECDALLDVLDELQDGARAYKTYEDWFAHMEAYTEELKRQKKQQEQLADCISLATLHSAKGLEYPIVHILDVNEGLMPYKKAVLDADLEEERRMFYVGVTRAKERLSLHSVKKYNGKEVDVSRFVGEMCVDNPSCR